MSKSVGSERQLVWFTILLASLFFTTGCSRRVELPQDEASVEQRRQKEVEMMHREMKNQ